MENKIHLILRLVVNTDEAGLEQVEARMKEDCPQLSFSPWIEREELDDCLETRGTAVVSPEEKEVLLGTWDNDWDTDDEDCFWAYGFNTKMFDSRVYYLQLQFS